MPGITDVLRAVDERNASDNIIKKNFDGVKIPFLSVAHGKTQLQFLSDLDIREEALYPHVEFYKYYRPAVPIDKGSYKIYEVAYSQGDAYEPSFVAHKVKEGKKINPDYFPYKGFAYIINLTALKAINIFLERGGDENTNLEKTPLIKSTDFGKTKDVNQAAAGREYIAQYQKIIKSAKAAQKEDDSVQIPTANGIYIYNFNTTVTNSIHHYIKTLLADGEDFSDLSLRDWVFSLTKEGQGLNTSYTLTMDYPKEEIEHVLVSPTYEFLDGTEPLSDFGNLVDRKRYKTDEGREEDYKVSNVAKEDEDDKW
jgi:hypothetical protein